MTTDLTSQLEALKNGVIQKMPPETVELMTQILAKLENSGISDRSLTTGASAPDFELPNPVGQQVKLSDLLNIGPVVLSFYRGEWCPFCNLEIRALQGIVPDLQQYSAQLVAISPELPNNSLTLQEKYDLTFPVLSDVRNTVARKYGLVFTIDPALQTMYKEFGVDLPARNGDNSYELPIPATYIIDRSGIIRYAYINIDHSQRAEPAEILAAVRKL